MNKYIAKHIGLSPKLLISAARAARAARAAPGTSRPPQGPQGHETSPGYFLAALGISAPAAENEQKTWLQNAATLSLHLTGFVLNTSQHSQNHTLQVLQS